MLMNRGDDGAEGQAYLAAFLPSMRQLGWIESHNMRIDSRWVLTTFEKNRNYASELIALAPDAPMDSPPPHRSC
jgi:hypothetical protein